MTPSTDVDRISMLVRSALAAVTGEPTEAFGEDTPLGEAGIDSLALIEALICVREQVLDDLGIGPGDVSELPTLPWLETVGELLAFVRSWVPANE
jgi:Phosphopantetheine attachment site